MGSKHRKYSREFKVETVKMVAEGGHKVSDVARDLGIHENLIYKWRSCLLMTVRSRFPAGRLKPGDEEFHHLKRELFKARQERDILKKALAYFAEEDRHGSGS